MPGAGFINNLKHYSLAWALVVSVILHAVLVGFLQPFKLDTPIQQPPLTIEIVQPKPEPPTEVVAPPEPPKPEQKPEPPPVKKPAPPKPIEQPAPDKVPDTPPPAEPSRTETPAPPVISAAPKVEEPPPTFTAPPPPPEPPKPAGPTEADIESARQAYGNSLSREIGKHKRYPRIAQMRGWEGTVRLLLEIDTNGKVVSVKVEEASNREVFNTEALEMVKRMVQPPPVPDTLRGRSFTVRVPIAFRLE